MKMLRDSFLVFILGIQKLILAGRIGEAIDMTTTLYPGLLERNPNLLFLLKCRQFVEMVSGADSEVRASAHSPRSSPNVSPTHSFSGTSVLSFGTSTSSSATNGVSSNGVDNGFVEDESPMDVEEMEVSPSGGVMNGNATVQGSSHSPVRGMEFMLSWKQVVDRDKCSKVHYRTHTHPPC